MPNFDLEQNMEDNIPRPPSPETAKLKLVETWTVEKYEGDPVPENLIETVYLVDGKITKTVRREE